jgi:hypothetical protein
MLGDRFRTVLVPVQLITGDNTIGFANPWARRRTWRVAADSSPLRRRDWLQLGYSTTPDAASVGTHPRATACSTSRKEMLARGVEPRTF